MEIIKIIIAGVVATSMMTAFSYIVSAIRNKQFREPELLNILLSKSSFFRLELSKKSSAGWILHYLIGWLFVLIFAMFWEMELFPISIGSGALLGLGAGIIGVLGWKIFFAISSNPPKITWSEYYIQLVIAHIIFGISTAVVYMLW